MSNNVRSPGHSKEIKEVLYNLWVENGANLTYDEAVPLLAAKGHTISSGWYYTNRNRYLQDKRPYPRIKHLLTVNPDRDRQEIVQLLRDEGFRPTGGGDGHLVERCRERIKRRLEKQVILGLNQPQEKNVTAPKQPALTTQPVGFASPTHTPVKPKSQQKPAVSASAVASQAPTVKTYLARVVQTKQLAVACGGLKNIRSLLAFIKEVGGLSAFEQLFDTVEQVAK